MLEELALPTIAALSARHDKTGEDAERMLYSNYARRAMNLFVVRIPRHRAVVCKPGERCVSRRLRQRLQLHAHTHLPVEMPRL